MLFKGYENNEVTTQRKEIFTKLERSRTQYSFKLGLVEEYNSQGKEGDKGMFYTEGIMRTKTQMHEKIRLQYVQRMSRNPI